MLSALVHPLFYVLLASAIAQGDLLNAPETGLGRTLLLLAIFNLAAGYGTAMVLAAVTAWRRGRGWLVLHTVAMPLYWLLISCAAYRAVWQLAKAPHGWEKTQHASRSRFRF